MGATFTLCLSALTWIGNRNITVRFYLFSRVQKFHKKEIRGKIMAPALMRRSKESQQGSPNRCFWAARWTRPRSDSHSLAINASFQASWPCWGIHSFPGPWRFRLSSAGSPSWFPSSPAWGGVSFSPNPQTALGVNYSAPPQLSPYHETCGGRTWG